MPTATNPATLPHLPAREKLITLAELGGLTVPRGSTGADADDAGRSRRRGRAIAAPMPSQVVDASLTFMMWAVDDGRDDDSEREPDDHDVNARIAHGREVAPARCTWMFALGYVAVWTAYSVAATLGPNRAARGVDHFRRVDRNAARGCGHSDRDGNLIQLTPLKQACLGHCQSPISFFMTRWRGGAVGAFRLGVEHGAFCVGCCWMLMAMLFVAG